MPDDTMSSIYPTAIEIPGDLLDQDCDGLELCYVDVDGDGDVELVVPANDYSRYDDSAGVVVLNDTVDLAEAAMWQSVFFEDESCGQCAPCRLGTQFVRQAVGRYRDSGDPTHLDHLDDVAWEMEEGSICGLGMVAALPVQTARQHFPDHFAEREG